MRGVKWETFQPRTKLSIKVVLGLKRVGRRHSEVAALVPSYLCRDVP